VAYAEKLVAKKHGEFRDFILTENDKVLDEDELAELMSRQHTNDKEAYEGRHIILTKAFLDDMVKMTSAYHADREAKMRPRRRGVVGY